MTNRRNRILNNNCIDCGELIDKIAKRCSRCSRKKYNEKRVASRHSLNKKCPICSKPISNNAKRCNTCSNRYYSSGRGYKTHQTKLKNGTYPPIGTERIASNGYVYVKITNGMSYINGEGNYQLKHRFVMENILGRKLTRYETVHHIDGDRTNNSSENLMLMSNTKHNKLNHFLALLNDCNSEERRKLFKTIIIRFPELNQLTVS